MRGQLSGTAVAIAGIAAGLEAALVAIIAALDKSGALPIAEARQALDEAYAGLSAEARALPQGLILRQLIEGLDRRGGHPGPMH